MGRDYASVRMVGYKVVKVWFKVCKGGRVVCKGVSIKIHGGNGFSVVYDLEVRHELIFLSKSPVLQ